MRVKVDRGAAAVRLETGAVSETRPAADGVTLLYDPAGRLAGVELRGVDPAMLGSVTVDLAGLPDQAADASYGMAIASPRPTPAPPPPPAYTGPLGWDPEAEAAMLEIPFFSRGRIRLAAAALARRRGLDRVTLEILHAVAR